MSITGLPPRIAAEKRDWDDMPFVADGTVAWPPVRVDKIETHTDDILAYSAECALGSYYAARLIYHLREYRDIGVDEAMASVCQAVVTRGLWTGYEAGFFTSVGQFIARGTVYFGDFDATLVQTRP